MWEGLDLMLLNRYLLHGCLQLQDAGLNELGGPFESSVPTG